MPDALVKLVDDIPISPAFSFIIWAKFSSDPAIPSAKATQASLPDAIIIPFNKFSYEIKIADFYFNDTASLLVDRIVKETKIKDAKIKKIDEKKYRVYAGPFNNIKSLQKSFNDISILEFENIEFIKND